MSKLQPSAVWKALDQKKQWQVLQRLLKRIHAQPFPPGVVNVGIGFRTLTSPENRRKYAHLAGKRRTSKRPRTLVASRKHPRVLTSELCLRFYVKKKLKSPPAPLPKFVRTRAGYRGTGRACDVPTDVAVPHGGRPQGYFISTGASGGVKAAGCCIVARSDDPAQQFLLGCHHALTLSMLNAAAPNQPAALPINVTADGSDDVLASTYDWSDLTPASGAGFDAALARAGPATIWPPDLLNHQPAAIMSSAFPPTQVTIHTPRGDLVAEFVGYLPSEQLAYGNRMLLIGPIFQFTAATFQGDSGSAVMDGATLCGMHFYGDPDAQSALSLTADAIFGQGRFSIGIRLP